MATLTAGYWYLVDATIYNADPESIDLSAGVEGVDYVQVKIPEGYNHPHKFFPSVNPLFGGRGFIILNGQRFETVTLEGKVDTRAEFDLIDQFCSIHNLNGADQVYICIKFNTNDYKLFRNHAAAQKEIAPGAVLEFKEEYNADESDWLSITLKFVIVWS